MYTSNPYASWQSGSGSYAFPRGAGAPTPSIFGALPFSASAPSSNAPMVAFTFTFSTSILSCSVIGPQNKVYYQIATDTPRPGFTFIHNVSSSVVAIVEWQQHPIIEIRNIVPKQYASQWVVLNSHGNARQFSVAGKQYVWAPGDGAISLYDPASRTLLGRISNSQNSVTLELSTYAIQAGLTEAAVLSTVLIMCGRNID